MSLPKEITWAPESEKYMAKQSGEVGGFKLFLVYFDNSPQLNPKGKWKLKTFLPCYLVKAHIAARYKTPENAKKAADRFFLYFWSRITDTEDGV
ncbi:hypothetical protein KAR91_48935 [Candidatus Pacearchaeota archaeon]|nr:hypothetical protein [Candidatus Pacearchaeota archaeon]